MSENMQDKVNETKAKKLAKRKKEDKKKLIILLAVTALSAVLGYLAGMMIDKLQKDGSGMPKFTEEVIGKLSLIMPIVLLVLNIILAIVAIVSTKPPSLARSISRATTPAPTSVASPPPRMSIRFSATRRMARCAVLTVRPKPSSEQFSKVMFAALPQLRS